MKIYLYDEMSFGLDTGQVYPKTQKPIMGFLSTLHAQQKKRRRSCQGVLLCGCS